jgi:hypothetical protein
VPESDSRRHQAEPHRRRAAFVPRPAFSGDIVSLKLEDRRSSLLALLFLAASTVTAVPLQFGNWWEYRESYSEHLGEVDAITDATTRFAVTGGPRRWFIDQRGGADPSPGPVESGDGWIRLAPWTGEDALPLPLEVGRTGPLSEGGQGWTVEAEEDVEVPAGTFRALRCALRSHANESVLWIAAGVGVVRETQGKPRLRPEIDRVLVRFRVAEPPVTPDRP